jgi:hypothetical protein
MPLPSWINEEFAWLHRELTRLNREVQGFSKRVGDLEKVLNASEAEQALPTSSIPPRLPATLDVDVEPTIADVGSACGEVPIEVVSDAPAAISSPGSDTAMPSRSAMPESKSAKSQPTAAATESGIEWEKVIGEKWMTWVGGFTLLLAIGFAVQWAWERFEAPDWLQVTGVHLLGIGLLVGGYLFHRLKMPILGQAVLGLGIFTLYASGYAALWQYKLWGEQTAFIEGVAITVLAIAIALRANSPGVILLGALGGYLTPILTSSKSDNYVGLFSYLAFLNVALVACAVWKAWNFVKPLALLATVAMFGLWIAGSTFDATNSQMVWGTQWFVALHALIFLVGSTVPPLLWKRTSTPADLLALTIGSFFFIGFTWLLFHSHPEQQLALVSWGMTVLHGVLFGVTFARVTNIDRMPRVHLALAAVFFTLAIPLQLDDAAYWGATWCVEAFVFTAVGVWFRDRQMCVSALIVFLLAAGRLILFDFPSPARDLGETGLDLRFLLFLISGLLGLLASGMYRLIPWTLQREADEWLRSIPAYLTVLGTVLITFAPPLQIDNKIYLGPAWAIEALVFTAVGLLVRDRVLCAPGLVVFAVAGLRLLYDAGVDLVPIVIDTRYGGSSIESTRSLTSTGWDRLFLATEFSSLMAMLAGSLYWLVPKLTWRDQQLYERERSTIGGSLLAIANLVLMAGLTLQWNGRLVLVLWTLDAAIVWAAGFKLDRLAVRWYATALGIFLVGGRALHEGYQLDGPFQLIFNERFGSLLLVALLYFVFGGLYRWKYGGMGFEALMNVFDGQRKRSASPPSPEAALDPVLGILGNLTLLTAISFEIHSWYATARQVGWQPFGNMQMAELATYSIVWAIYAAIVVAIGFVVRYPLFRILGLAAFGPIVLKVFFYDLAELKWLPRVLALAVLGLMLLGVSLLYQKFAARLLNREQPEVDGSAE